MTLRLLKLPDDFEQLSDMLTDTFQYPENESWSVQTDEMEKLISSVRNFKRIWPLVRLIQFLSPAARDIFRGYVWEEDDRLVGITTVQRRGGTKVWVVGAVGVLPAYRRRGIARKLVEAGLDLIRQHGGEKTFLSVIDGNLPAYQLYESLGFEHYSGTVEFQLSPASHFTPPTLPQGFSLTPLKRFDWQPRYELEKRISPESILKYEPVDVERFQLPVLMRLLYPLLMLAQSSRQRGYAIYTSAGDEIVARCAYTVPTRGTGLNILQARLDPAYPELAPFIVQFLLHHVTTLSPDLRIEFSVPYWQNPLVSAADEAGFERRLEYCSMGLAL